MAIFLERLSWGMFLEHYLGKIPWEFAMGDYLDFILQIVLEHVLGQLSWDILSDHPGGKLSLETLLGKSLSGASWHLYYETRF